jgi:hypothetical protein
MSSAHSKHDHDSRAAPAPDAPGTVRLSINLGKEDAEKLKQISKRKNISITEAVRRAITALSFIDGVQARGAEIKVSEDGILKEVLIHV